MSEPMNPRDEVRQRIVEIAARLLRELGPVAVTTRGVAEAAGVQAPTIYRLFGDKDGLLDAVAEHVMAGYVGAKSVVAAAASEASVDPVEDLRAGWDNQIDFGRANPTLFRLLSDPDRVQHSPAAEAGRQILISRVHRIAVTGQLRVSEDRAVDLIQAAGIGLIHVLLTTAPRDGDRSLSDTMFDAVLARILTATPAPADAGPAAAAVALRAVSSDLTALSAGERELLSEWLDRIARDG